MKRGFLAAILVVALVAGLGAGWLLARGGLGGSALSLLSTPATGRINVLLLGADDRPGEPGRSDTAIVVSADLNNHRVSLMSIPRDTWSNIPGHGWDKFNHAYAFGKEQLSLRTLNGLLGIPIDHYIVVNMQGFVKAVDALGGVTIDVEKNMDYEDPYDTPPLKIHLKKGLQRLNGTEALKYVRFRHDAESDWGRMARQQKFLRALAAEALKPQNLLKLPSLANQLYSSVRTDLSKADLLRLATALSKGLDPQSMDAVELKGRDRTFGGIYYLQLDLLDARRAAYKMLKGKDPDPAFLARADADNQAYLASIAKEEQRQAALAKAAQEAAKKASEQAGRQPQPDAPGATPTGPGQGGAAGTTGSGGGATGGAGTGASGTGATGGTTSGDSGAPTPTSAVAVVDASGKGLGPRYAGLLREQGLQVSQVSVATELRASTEIVVHKADAVVLQKVMSLFPKSQLVVQPPTAGQSADLEVILGADLGGQE